jgi:hypothetical protein
LTPHRASLEVVLLQASAASNPEGIFNEPSRPTGDGLLGGGQQSGRTIRLEQHNSVVLNHDHQAVGTLMQRVRVAVRLQMLRDDPCKTVGGFDPQAVANRAEPQATV